MDNEPKNPAERAIDILLQQRAKLEVKVERQRLELAKINQLYLQRVESMTIGEGFKLIFRIIISKIKIYGNRV